MGTLLEWAGMSNADAVDPVAFRAASEGSPEIQEVPGREGTLASFLAFSGVATTTHYRVFASCTVQDFAECIPGWTPNGRPPSMAQRGAAKLAHATARRLLLLDPWPGAEQAIAIPQPPQQQPVLHGIPGGPQGLLNIPTINVAEIIDQHCHQTITYLEEPEWLEARNHYTKVMDRRRPPELEEYTREQLTAVRHVLSSHRGPYVDFAIFGAHGNRRVKRQAMSGLLFNSGGLLHKVEMYGPPCIEDWLECWGVLASVLISLKAVSRPNLDTYKDWMIYQARTNGHTVWPLLYQTDVRCRSEKMPIIRDALVSRHNERITSRLPSDFDAQCPWDKVFALAVESSQSERWWAKEFEKPAMRILTKMGHMADFVDNDAMVENANARTAAGSARGAPTQDEVFRGQRPQKQPPAKKQRTLSPPGGEGAHPRKVDGVYVTNNSGNELCKKYNKGTCSGPTCKLDSSRKHQCNLCLKNDHPAIRCGNNSGGSAKGPAKGQKKWGHGRK